MTLPRTPSFRLDGKRALVAGASSGIGEAAAVALAEAGAEVTLVARRADELERLAGEMRAEGWSATPLALDVTQDVALKWCGLPATNRPINPRGWLRRVTINRAVDLLRGRRHPTRDVDALAAIPAIGVRLTLAAAVGSNRWGPASPEGNPSPHQPQSDRAADPKSRTSYSTQRDPLVPVCW